MTISLHVLLAMALCAVAVAALGGDRTWRRRMRRPRLLQAVAAGPAALLVPVNLYVANRADAAGGTHLAFAAEVGSVAALCAVGVLGGALRISRTLAMRPRRVLAVGAHPDDLELGCGGTLAKLVDSGHEVRGLVMTTGERGGERSARAREALAGGRFVGATSLRVLALADTRLAEQEAEMVCAIEELVHRFNPDIILTHSGNDQHQDHRAVHLATLRAARRHSSILCYESPSATAAFQPSVFVDIAGYVDVKTAAVAAHRDQRDKPYLTPERVRGLAVFRGGQARTRHAEAYEPVRLVGDL